METNDGVSPLADAAASVEAESTAQPQAPRRRRTRAKPETPPPPPPQAEPGKAEMRLNVPPEQLYAAMDSMLSSLAVVTKTREPDKKEVKGMADTLAFGVNHTRIAMDERAGPWVPFTIMVLGYAVPRALERLMEVAEARKGAPAGGTFRPTLVEGGEAPKGQPESQATDGPVPARGAVVEE